MTDEKTPDVEPEVIEVVDLEILQCTCSPGCKLLAVALHGTRLTPKKHSGSWKVVETCEVDVKKVERALI